MFGMDYYSSSSSEDDFEIMLLEVIGDSDISSSDDEATLFHKIKRRKKEDYFEHEVPRYSDAVFMEHFRVNRDLAENIAEKFRNSSYYNYQSGGYGKITPLQQILIFLWFAGHESARCREMADRFNISISTTCLIIRRVTHFISSLSGEIIQWPSAEEKKGIESYFRGKGLPGMVGAIGGTHIKIDKPQEDPYSYLNKKRYYSIQLQLVSDHKHRIRDIFVGYQGSVHQGTVFKDSTLFETLADKCEDSYIVGNSVYPCLQHLLTPYRNTGALSRQQINFNSVLSRNKSVVEHCFGLLKQRFKQLLHIKLRSITDIAHFIRACCVLHNLALEDDFVFERNEGENDKDASGEEEIVDLDNQDDELGANKRNSVAEQLLI